MSACAIPCPRVFAIAVILAAAAAGPVSASYKHDIGYVALAAELGSGKPTGAGIPVSQIESLDYTGGYMPDTNHAQFAGMTFLNVSDSSDVVSGHATTVGQYLYGSTSVAPGIEDVDVYKSQDWAGDGFLAPGFGILPPPRRDESAPEP